MRDAFSINIILCCQFWGVCSCSGASSAHNTPVEAESGDSEIGEWKDRALPSSVQVRVAIHLERFPGTLVALLCEMLPLGCCACHSLNRMATELGRGFGKTSKGVFSNNLSDVIMMVCVFHKLG